MTDAQAIAIDLLRAEIEELRGEIQRLKSDAWLERAARAIARTEIAGEDVEERRYGVALLILRQHRGEA